MTHGQNAAFSLNPRQSNGLSFSIPGVVRVKDKAVAPTSERSGAWRSSAGMALLVVNLAGDLINAGLEIEPRAVVGLPVVSLLLWYLFIRVAHVSSSPRPGTRHHISIPQPARSTCIRLDAR
jgi:hypothetical protein